MRIGIDISQIVYTGGVVTYTTNLVKSLLSIDEKNMYTLYGSSFGKYEELQQFGKSMSQKNIGKKLFPLPLSVIETLGNRVHQIPIEIVTGPLDVYHSSDWVQFPSRARKVTTIHDLAIYEYPEYMPQEIIDTQKRRLAWVKKECNAIIADSESTKKDIIKYLEFSQDKVHVVQLGVDVQFVPQSDLQINQVKEKYEIKGEYIVMFGLSGYRKNVTGVISAFEKIQNKIPHTLVIIGKSDEISLSNSSRVKILDTVSSSDLVALYSGSTCFVYPSYYEGFGLPILEAMAAGTLVITSKKGSLSEIIHESNSIIEDPHDEKEIEKRIIEMVELLPKDRQKRIAQGIAHTSTFTWEKCAQETLSVYKEVLV